MSNLRLVNDALRLIGVLPEGQDASAEQGELALRTASDIVDEWADDGFVVAWDSNATIDEDCNLVGVELNALKYALAVRLCPFHGRDPSGTLAALAASSVQKFKRIQILRGLEAADPTLPISEAVRQYWNLETDS